MCGRLPCRDGLITLYSLVSSFIRIEQHGLQVKHLVTTFENAHRVRGLWPAKLLGSRQGSLLTPGTVGVQLPLDTHVGLPLAAKSALLTTGKVSRKPERPEARSEPEVVVLERKLDPIVQGIDVQWSLAIEMDKWLRWLLHQSIALDNGIFQRHRAL